MSESAPAASKGPDVSLVDLERELEGLLLEYESASRAWPKEPHILTRAKIGRRVEDALKRICELHHAIGTTQARTIPDAAVQLRRLAVLLDGQDAPILRLQAALEDQGEAVRRLLASAVAAVEAAAENGKSGKVVRLRKMGAQRNQTKMAPLG